MNVLLINDTSNGSNPGCRAATAGVRDVILTGVPNATIESLAVGYWSAEFASLSAPRTKQDFGAQFPHSMEAARSVNADDWSEIQRISLQKDTNLRGRLQWAEVVVVNGEGSIHHNSPRALALLALCSSAVDAHVPTFLVNATIQLMDEKIMKRVLPRLAGIHARERRTADYLKQLGIESTVTADLAFRSLTGNPEGPLDSPDRCLLTSGVLVTPQHLRLQIETIREQGLTPVYFSVGDGNETAVARIICKDLHVPIVESTTVPWESLSAYFAQFPLAVSGRHHINAFLMQAGVPFVPMPSNTWKVEATLELLNYSQAPVTNPQQLAEALLRFRGDLKRYAAMSGSAGKCGKVSAGSYSLGTLSCGS